MLEKELAEAIKMAERANKEVEKMRNRLLAEAEKQVRQGKRELQSARKKQTMANKRLKKARESLKKRPSSENRKQVDQLVTEERLHRLSKTPVDRSADTDERAAKVPVLQGAKRHWYIFLF